jgi:hypothetical protein
MQPMRDLAFAAFMAIAITALPSAAPAQLAVKQIELTEKHIEGFIAAQPDLAPVFEKMQGAAAAGHNPQLQSELDAVSRKHGFADFAEYEDVAANISTLMAGIDPQTKVFTEPRAAIKKEIEDVTADMTIPEADKKQLLEELNETLKAVQPIQFPSNIDLVRKHYDRIDAALT